MSKSRKIITEQSVINTGQVLLLEDAFRFKKFEQKEQATHELVCDYLNENHPNVMFLSDPSGIRVSQGLANRIKRMRAKGFKIPDLIILEPRFGYCGMVIEIKRDREVLLKKDGTLKKNEHHEEQYRSLHHLHQRGYMALFGLGYEDTINKIQIYLEGKKKPIVK